MENINTSMLYIKIFLNEPAHGNVFEYIQNGITITDADSRIVYTNPAFTRITGYSAEEALGNNPGMLHSGRHDKSFYEDMWKSIKEQDYWEGEIWNRQKSGVIFPEYLTISAVNLNEDNARHYIAIFSDISYLKADIYRKLKLAFYDPLTELPNRTLYIDRVNHLLKSSANTPTTKHAILFMDLDKFKQVNDTHGHLVGDHLLKMVGERLTAIVRAEDTVARVGGDEFTAVLKNIKDKADVDALAKRMVDSIEKPFLIDGHKIEISISIGISIFPSDAHKIEELLNGADKAMYEAKRNKTKVNFM